MLEIREIPEFQTDLENLESDALRILATSLQLEIAANLDIRRKRLGWVKSVGDLTGYCAVKFDLIGFETRFRMIFKYLPSEISPSSVLFTAVGPRFDHQVYRNAAARLPDYL